MQILFLAVIVDSEIKIQQFNMEHLDLEQIEQVHKLLQFTLPVANLLYENDNNENGNEFEFAMNRNEIAEKINQNDFNIPNDPFVHNLSIILNNVIKLEELLNVTGLKISRWMNWLK